LRFDFAGEVSGRKRKDFRAETLKRKRVFKDDGEEEAEANEDYVKKRRFLLLFFL
jgi:hypothetical protein